MYTALCPICLQGLVTPSQTVDVVSASAVPVTGPPHQDCNPGYIRLLCCVWCKGAPDLEFIPSIPRKPTESWVIACLHALRASPPSTTEYAGLESMGAARLYTQAPCPASQIHVQQAYGNAS